MKKIIIAGFGQPIIDLYHSLEHQFEIIGVILDYERRTKFPFFYDFLNAKNLPVCSFDDLKKVSPDAVIVMNYNKLIAIPDDNKTIILNIHMGLLPVYRGNNANSWSILNGDRNVGYTLHEVTPILDGGKIFHKFAYHIPENETYFHAKEAIKANINKVLPGVIAQIIDGKLEGVDQENEKFIYGSKLIPEDGIITRWNKRTAEFVNKYMIFSRPLGTGLKMIYKDKVVEISKLSTIPDYLESRGIAGAVVMKNPNGSVWIKTRDTAISFDELMIDDKIVKPADLFNIGERL